MSRTLRTPRDLAAAGLIAPERAAALGPVAARYAIAVTPQVAGLIDRADPADPIAAQYLPDPRELDAHPHERADPIGDAAHSPVKGIVHRYRDRVLLLPTLACAVYCRFCFRRESVGAGGLTQAEMDAAFAYVRAHPEIWEVIVTGGDPFVLAPRRLAALVRALDAIAHVQAIRFHTRVPVADPARVTGALVAALDAGKAVHVVLHGNHARELNAAARAACARLVRAGMPLLAQTVLLKGVNDDPDTLADLLRTLVALRIKPYYLHHPDLAPGTARFRTTLAAGRALMRALRGRVSGLALPTYVLDVPGGAGKVPVGPCHARDGTVEDLAGRRHDYPLA